MKIATAVAIALIALSLADAHAADLKILLPLHRVAYQTNEWIDISVVRTAPNGLKDGNLVLGLSGQDGGKASFTFPVTAAAGNPAAATENLHVNGALLRPDNYTVDVTSDGASAQTHIEVYSHLRRTTFKLIDWGSRAAGASQGTLGEDSVGMNLDLAAYGGLSPDDLIRGGVDYMWCCTMSGGSQMDLRRECDWSDPYVLGGGIARVARRAFADRVNPNCLGVHIYDEPALTTWKDPVTGQSTPFNVPAQDRSFKAAFGHDPIRYNEVKPDNPADVAAWDAEQKWRLSLLDAAWKLTAFTINYVKPDFLSANQGDWLFSGYGQGYYFNYMNSQPVYSGHGGYDYLNGGDFAPGYFFEFGRIRQTDKPNWYLPMWSCGHSDLFRAEQYLSFQNNLQGMDKPPDLQVQAPSTTPASDGIVESNKAMARLGTIFTTMPVTRPDTAILFSLSHNLNAELKDMKDTYFGDGQFHKLLYAYMASKILHIPFFPIVEEDILDGSLTAHHRVLVIVGNNALAPNVIAALQKFIAHGGIVLLSDDSKVQIPGAKSFHYPLAGVELNENMAKWSGAGQWDKWNGTIVNSDFFKTAVPIAEAMKPALEAAGVKPVFGCDQPGVVASRQSEGDIEYLFAVNASPDYDSHGWYNLRTAVANISVPDDGRPVYNAMLGGRETAFQKRGTALSGEFRFGPGQMRVFARTARPIGGVEVLDPIVTSDSSSATNPGGVYITAALVDDQKRVLSGSAPMRIEVTDPLGVKRFDLYRATDAGSIRLTLPLGANDPAGQWSVVVRDLLANTSGAVSFRYNPASQFGAMAGETRRAAFFGRDRENIFRFFRLHKDIAIVKGTSDFDSAEADRLVEILKPWDVKCTIVSAADAARPRDLSPAMAVSWVGLGGREPDVALSQPAILLGTPEDNVLIKFMDDHGFLPYKPVKDQFPGRGRGMIAWQDDGIRYFNGETITLIGYDPDGLSEAVGSMYDAMAGIDPITPMILPDDGQVVPAVINSNGLNAPTTVWQSSLPDRPVAMKTLPGGQMLLLSDDGTLDLLQPDGKLAWQKTFDGGEQWAMDASTDGSVIAVGIGRRVVALDKSGKQLFETVLSTDKVAPTVSFIAVSPNGKRIAAGGSYNDWRDGWKTKGKLIMLASDGKLLWTQGGPDPANAGKETLADPMLTASFAADGRDLIVPLSKEVRVINTETGALDQSAAESAGSAPLLRAGPEVYYVNGANKLLSFNSTAGSGKELASQPDLPANTKIVALSPSGPTMIIGTEGDGTVRAYNLSLGSGARKPGWEFAFPTRIVKRIASHNGLTAVAYWGGSLRVLDAAGKVVAGQQFLQDFAAVGWSGDHLVVALADGRVMAMSL